jgi:DNA modification methylase
MDQPLDIFGDPIVDAKPKPKLRARWEYPPFSVLNARDGWWQDRKREWLGLGIKSELGRGDDLTFNMGDMNYDRLKEREAVKKKYARAFAVDMMRGEQALSDGASVGAPGDVANMGVSIFDPVLCELAYRWFSPRGGRIVDPFAGGSVRGVVASHLGRAYDGVELRAEQVEANRGQGDICSDPTPTWYQGDSRNIGNIVPPGADMIFTCPPYADLEVYSEDPADISRLAYPEFIEAYREIIAETWGLLAPDRFAAVVVGEVRGKSGAYYNFVGDTIAAFIDAGAAYYNEAILVTAVGSLPVRINKQFNASRKIGKTHQQMLVFVKGDPKRATATIRSADDET